MDPTLKWVGDTFENTFLQRAKLIHSVGNVAKVKFVPQSNKFTGLFQGSDYGFIRMSAAQLPKTDKSTAAEALHNFVPGFSLKMMVDGQPSANLVAMYGTSG